MKGLSMGRTLKIGAHPSSPLNGVDARVKIGLSLALSLAVMLPAHQLLAVLAADLLLLAWARLLAVAGRILWRLKWALLLLFAFDWWLVSFDLAVVVGLRMILLALSFAIVFATTKPEEFCLALEWLRMPYRYAFSLSVAVHSLGLIEREWRALIEAQRARGAWKPARGWRGLPQAARDLVALSVPAVVMTAHQAWSLTEAAYARGFDSPARRPYRRLHMNRTDWLLTLLVLALLGALAFWRFWPTTPLL